MPENETTDTEMRQASRETILRIWDHYKKGNSDSLSAEERVLLNVMIEHEHELGHVFDNCEDADTKEYTPGKETNPFLHISLHTLIENQLAEKNPVEVIQFYNTLKKKSVPAHTIQHHLMAIVFPLILKTINSAESFDQSGYRSLLKKMKHKKPEKIQDAIKREVGSLLA